MFVVTKEVYYRCMFYKNGFERWVAGKNLLMAPWRGVAFPPIDGGIDRLQ